MSSGILAIYLGTLMLIGKCLLPAMPSILVILLSLESMFSEYLIHMTFFFWNTDSLHFCNNGTTREYLERQTRLSLNISRYTEYTCVFISIATRIYVRHMYLYFSSLVWPLAEVYFSSLFGDYFPLFFYRCF